MAKTEAEKLQAQLDALRAKLSQEENGNQEDDSEDQNVETDDDQNEDGQNDDDNNEDEGKETDDKKTSEEDEKVAALKKSLDALDAKLKEEKKKNRELERAKQAAEIDRLKKEGKEVEALKAELKQLKAEAEEARAENITLKRDQVLDMALSGHDFRSERSRNMARRELLDGLTQNEDGDWVSTAGDNVVAYVQKYVNDEENAFLLKPKVNRGSGMQPPAKDTKPTQPQGIFDMSQDKMIARVKKQMGLK